MATNGNNKHGKIEVPVELFLELSAKFELGRRAANRPNGAKLATNDPDFVPAISGLSKAQLNDLIQHNGTDDDQIAKQSAFYAEIV